MAAELYLGIVKGMGVTVSVGDIYKHDGGCHPEKLREIARTLRIIADAVERGRTPRTAKAPLAVKVG